jgi:hypothetical protein
MADRGSFAAVRAAVFAAVCMLLATAGHALSSGSAPPAAAVLAGGALVWLAARRVTGSQRSLRAIVPAVGAAQFGLHLLFTYTARSLAAAALAESGAHAGHHHPAPSATGHGLWMTVAMVAAHAAAGLAAAWWLRRGEATAWALAAALSARAAAPFHALAAALRALVAPEPSRGVAAIPAFGPPSRLDGAVLRHSLSRRGPPVALAA